MFEARDRVGGRVHSRRLDDGTVIELGAEFILPGCEEVLRLAERLGLDLCDKGMRYGDREPRGVDVSATALELAVAAVDAGLRALGYGADLESARSFLDRLPIDAGAREAIVARVEVSAAASADAVPASELALLAATSDQPAPSIAGGNQRLAIGLAEPLAAAVRLQSPVQAVDVAAAGPRICGAWGEERVDACVIAVPAHLVAAIRFEPRLSDAVRSALDTVAVGHAAKLFLPLRTPAPPSATLSVPDRYWAWTATGEGDRPQPLVSAFAGSASALCSLDVNSGPGAWVGKLGDLRPDLEPVAEEAMLSTWDDDPWARGAYSVSIGPEAEEILRQGAGPIQFAGEYMGGEMRALMEGALRSGAAAADRIE